MSNRDYRQEYDNYHSLPEQKKKRALRNKARRAALRANRVYKGDGKDVHHRGSLKNPRNTAVKSKHANRSFKRRSDHTEIKKG